MIKRNKMDQDASVQSISRKTSNGAATGSLRIIKPLVRPIKDLVKSKKGRAENLWFWSSSEYNSNNAWDANFSNGNFNNNSKYNSNALRPVVALDIDEIKDWILAFEDCCRGKRTSTQCILYRLTYEFDLIRLAMEVKNGTYYPSVSTTFLVTRPKLREIFAANFRDRIVQHWVTLRLNPILEQRFESCGNVSFNCRLGYGTLASVLKLRDNIEEVSKSYTDRETYIGKFDMKGFFMSIDKRILLNLLIPFIRDNYKGDDIDKLIWLVQIIILHRPQSNCIRRGNVELWKDLPIHKSLFGNPDHLGMPIGNITSQLLANFYLSFFDEYIVSLCGELGAKYIRFVDDFVVVGKSKKDIKFLQHKADEFLKEKLGITLHKDKVYIQDAKKGVKFLGSVIRPGRIYLSNQTVGNFVDLIVKVEHLCHEIQKRTTGKRLIMLESYVSATNSYLGFLIQTNSYAIRYNIFESLHWFWLFCDVNEKTTKVSIREEYKLINYLK